MANKSISMINIRQILRMHHEHHSMREIEKYLGVARKTVSKYISLAQSAAITYPDIQALSDEELSAIFLEREKPEKERYAYLESQFEYFEKQLKKTGVTKFLLWEEYKREHPGGYNFTQFCFYLNAYIKTNKAVMHMEHKAGDKLFIDYAGKRLSVVDKKTGEVEEVEVYVAILGSSQLTYIEAVPSQRKEDFISATENALHFYGGVPSAIVPDNLKSAVTRSHKYEPHLNEAFKDFALHYGTAILPTRSAKPQDKALVEGAVKIIYTRIYAKLRNRVFHSLTDLNEAMWELLDNHNNTKFQNRHYSRQELFEESEKSELKALPISKYEIKEYARLTVNKNCHIYISCDQHYYSVPYKYIGKQVRVIYTKNHVEIYFDYKRIAFHIRDYKKYRYSTVREHLPSHHQFVSDWNPEKFIQWASGIGFETELYIRKVLESKSHPEQAYKSCIGILSFNKKYGKQRLNNACKRAINYNCYSYMAINNILKKGLDKLDDSKKKQYKLPLHENIRGESYYH
jgi:transposase